MTESFADRVRAAGLASAAELPDGVDLALELRSRVEREGFACEDVFADDDGWCFFVSAQSSPVCVTLYRTTDEHASTWHVSVVYEGGLSSIWSEQNARQGAQLAARVRALLDDRLAQLLGPNRAARDPLR